MGVGIFENRSANESAAAYAASQMQAQRAQAAAQAQSKTLAQLDQERIAQGQISAVPNGQPLSRTQKLAMMAGNITDEQFNKMVEPLDEKTRADLLAQRQRYLDIAKAQNPTLGEIDQQRMFTGSNTLY